MQRRDPGASGVQVVFWSGVVRLVTEITYPHT